MSEPLQGGDINISQVEGKIYLSFPQAVHGVLFTPEEARHVGVKLAQNAYEVRYGVKPSAGTMISDQKRQICINRTRLILRNLEGKDPGYIAMQVVDSILAEIS